MKKTISEVCGKPKGWFIGELAKSYQKCIQAERDRRARIKAARSQPPPSGRSVDGLTIS